MLWYKNIFIIFPSYIRPSSLTLSLSLFFPYSHSSCAIHYVIKLLRGLRNRIGDLEKLANVIETKFLSRKVVVDDQMPNRIFYDRAR